MNQRILFIEPAPQVALQMSPYIHVVSSSKNHDGVYNKEQMMIFYDQQKGKYFGRVEHMLNLHTSYAIDDSAVDIILKNVYMNELPHTGLKILYEDLKETEFNEQKIQFNKRDKKTIGLPWWGWILLVLIGSAILRMCGYG